MGNSRINYKKVRKLVNAKVPDKEIAKLVGCEPQSISIYRTRTMRVFYKPRPDWVKGDELIRQGVSDKAVAGILGVVEYTVRNRRQDMARKALGIEKEKQSFKFTGVHVNYKEWLEKFLKTPAGLKVLEYNERV